MAVVFRQQGHSLGILFLCLLSMLPLSAAAQSCWPLWQGFGSHFIQGDGRVLADESEQRFSSSEGQAYALFFSLVANDRGMFDRILGWTAVNLSEGDLGVRLPAWQWGKRVDGNWGVMDANPASDADVWLAYTLLEAGRLWHETRYTVLGKLMLANIRAHEIRELSGLGAMLLPAPTGFELEQRGGRLNPSYLPVQLLRAFAKTDPSGPWAGLIANNLKLLQGVNPKGFAPDWAAYSPGRGFIVDTERGGVGSYDAIRVYLWWGMLPKRDSMSTPMKKTLYGMNRLIPSREVSPPLTVDTQSGEISGVSPPGFSAALLPYFATIENARALRLQRDRLLTQLHASGDAVLIGASPRYYDQVLALFGQGWLEHRFGFSLQGQLVVHWNRPCSER